MQETPNIRDMGRYCDWHSGEVDTGGTREEEGMYSRQSHANVGLARPPQDKYDRFEAWLRKNGAQFDLVSY
jgi:hypothetical protein